MDTNYFLTEGLRLAEPTLRPGFRRGASSAERSPTASARRATARRGRKRARRETKRTKVMNFFGIGGASSASPASQSSLRAGGSAPEPPSRIVQAQAAESFVFFVAFCLRSIGVFGFSTFYEIERDRLRLPIR